MTDGWWVRLVYDDPTPMHELRADHMSKAYIALTRHLAESHAHRFDRQPGHRVVLAQHCRLHGISGENQTSLWPRHPHEALGVQPGS